MKIAGIIFPFGNVFSEAIWNAAEDFKFISQQDVVFLALAMNSKAIKQSKTLSPYNKLAF